MKTLRFMILTALLMIVCSTGVLAAEFADANALFQYWYSTQETPSASPYPDYVCGVWSTDGTTDHLTIAVTKDEAGEAGKSEIPSQ